MDMNEELHTTGTMWVTNPREVVCQPLNYTLCLTVLPNSNAAEAFFKGEVHIWFLDSQEALQNFLNISLYTINAYPFNQQEL